ncbi:MAG: RidA family protein, partial [Bacteroidota bacterium]
MKNIYPLIALLCFGLFSTSQAQVKELKRYQREGSTILKGVAVPADKALFISSGMVAPVKDENAKGVARYGDTYTQSIGALKNIEAALQEAGLTMNDVVSLKVFIAPDPSKNDQVDFEGWFKAYPKFFMNEQNPNKVARTTLGVHSLARPGLLVEVEVVAVYPD